MKKNIFFLSILCSLILLNGCKKSDSLREEGCNYTPCSDKRLTISYLDSKEGKIGYEAEWALYFIALKSDNGSFDNTVVAIPCEISDDLKQIGKKVIVSGELKSSCNNPKPILGGQQIYYLKISKIKGVDK